MSIYSRVTVIGERRRLDVVLFADQSFGVLFLDLLWMFEEPMQ